MTLLSRPARLFLLLLAVMGLTLATAPPAVAAPGPTLGKTQQIDLALVPLGSVPSALDLSGGRFRFADGATTGTCVTDEDGVCDVDWVGGRKVVGGGTSSLGLPSGTYTVTQVGGVDGLQQQPGTIGTVRLCDCWHPYWIFWEKPDRIDLPVRNTSLYRESVTAQVVDAASGKAVKQAKFRLTGPGFPGGGPVLDAGTATTGASGRLEFDSPRGSHIYRPGLWTLTPVAIDPKYTSVPVSVNLSAGAPGGSSWAFGTVALAKPAPVPPPPPAPRTGTGTVRLLAVGPVPDVLDLSGVRFALAGTSGVSGTCVTDAAGSCRIDVMPTGTSSLPATGASHIALPEDTYAVTQETTVAGLAVDPSIGNLVLCADVVAGKCAATVDASNESRFRQTISVAVTRDGVPVDGLELALTRAGSPDDEGTAPAAAEPGVPATTDADGIAVWNGWFLPGSWTVAPADGGDALLVFDLEEAPESQVLPIRLPTAVVPDDGTAEETSTPTTTPSTPTTTAAPTTSASPSGPVGGGAANGPAVGAAGSSARVQAVPGGGVTAPITDAVQSPASTPAPTSAPAPASAGRGAAAAGEQVFTADGEPELRTAGSTQLLSPGLVLGVGVLFVAVVIAGAMFVRRRTRGLG